MTTKTINHQEEMEHIKNSIVINTEDTLKVLMDYHGLNDDINLAITGTTLNPDSIEKIQVYYGDNEDAYEAGQ